MRDVGGLSLVANNFGRNNDDKETPVGQRKGFAGNRGVLLALI